MEATLVPSVKRLLTVNEFIEETGLRPTTTRKLIASGKLPIVRAERRVLIARETLEAFVRGELNET